MRALKLDTLSLAQGLALNDLQVFFWVRPTRRRRWDPEEELRFSSVHTSECPGACCHQHWVVRINMVPLASKAPGGERDSKCNHLVCVAWWHHRGQWTLSWFRVGVMKASKMPWVMERVHILLRTAAARVYTCVTIHGFPHVILTSLHYSWWSAAPIKSALKNLGFVFPLAESQELLTWFPWKSVPSGLCR